MKYILKSRGKTLKTFKTYTKAVQSRKVVNQLKGFKGWGKTYILKKK